MNNMYPGNFYPDDYWCDTNSSHHLAQHNLNMVIHDLEEMKIDQGRNRIEFVIEILSGVNNCYEKDNLLSVDKDGNRILLPTIFWSSDVYNRHSINRRTIEKIQECIHLLNSPNPETNLVIEILQGKRCLSE